MALKLYCIIASLLQSDGVCTIHSEQAAIKWPTKVCAFFSLLSTWQAGALCKHDPLDLLMRTQSTTDQA